MSGELSSTESSRSSRRASHAKATRRRVGTIRSSAIRTRCAVGSSPSESATESAASCSCEAATSGEASTEATASAGAARGEAVLADLEDVALELEPVVHGDRVLSVMGRLVDNRAGSGGGTVVVGLDVGADDVSSLAEQVLDVLPSSGERKLNHKRKPISRSNWTSLEQPPSTYSLHEQVAPSPSAGHVPSAAESSTEASARTGETAANCARRAHKPSPSSDRSRAVTSLVLAVLAPTTKC